MRQRATQASTTARAKTPVRDRAAAKAAATTTVAKARTLAKAKAVAKVFNLPYSLESGAVKTFLSPFLIHARERI
jgi:hypothetical protein